MLGMKIQIQSITEIRNLNKVKVKKSLAKVGIFLKILVLIELDMKTYFNNFVAKYHHVILAIAISTTSSNALASVGGLGGLRRAQTAAENIKTGLYALVGVIAMIYLIYLGVMAFTEKKSWADFGWGVVYVSLVGGAVALGGWAWTLFA